MTLPAKMKMPCLLVCFALLAMPLAAQPPKKTISLEQEVVAVSIDRPGDLYVTLVSGKLLRIDADGTLLPLSEVSHSPALFDPRDGSRLFAYYRDTQRYAYFSVSREMSAHMVDSAFAIQPWLVCPSGDHNVWIADAADNVIRKVNSATSRIDAEIAYGSNVAAIRFMREYQGFLFVLDPSRGIVVFSGMGRELRTLGTGAVTYFNFLGEELYYPDTPQQLAFFNLFNAEKRIVKLPRAAPFSLVTDTRVFSVNGRTVEIFEAPR